MFKCLTLGRYLPKRSYRITKMTTNTEKKIKEQIKTDFEEPNLGMIMPRKNKKERLILKNQTLKGFCPK